MSSVSAANTPNPPAGRPPRLLRNVLFNWMGYGVATLVGFFLSPFVVRHLGESAYGVWVLIGSLTGYMGLLDFGVRGAVTRYVARFHAQQEHKELNRTVSTGLSIFLLAGLLAIVIATSLAIFVLPRFKVPEELVGTGQLVLMLSGWTVAFALAGGVFGGVLVGLQRFDLSNSIEMASLVLRAVATVAALKAGMGLLALSVIQLVFGVLSSTANFVASKRILPELRVRLQESTRQHLRLILSFSLLAFAIHVSNYLVFYTSSLVIGAFLPIGLVTYYSIAGNLLNYTRALLSGVSTTMTPLASSIQAQGDNAPVVQVFMKGTRYATLLVLPIAVTFLLRGESFIALWMGPQFGPISGAVLRVMTLALAFVAANQIAMSTMLGLNRHKALVPQAVGEGLINLLLSILLIRDFGLVGVAWGMAIPSLLSSWVFWPWYIRRTLQVPVARYVVSTWLRPLAGVVPFAAACFVVEQYWPASNLFWFFLQVGICLPLVLAGSWQVVLLPGDRERLLGAASRALAWFHRPALGS